MPFHKSCYTSRSSGYKYRSLSTDTGERKRQRPSITQEVSAIDKKFHNLQDDISVLINKELADTERSRSIIYDKFNKIDAKINVIVELRNNVVNLRQSLSAAENTLDGLCQRIQRIEVMGEINSVKFRKNGNRTKALMEEDDEEEIFNSEMTPHVAA